MHSRIAIVCALLCVAACGQPAQTAPSPTPSPSPTPTPTPTPAPVVPTPTPVGSASPEDPEILVALGRVTQTLDCAGPQRGGPFRVWCAAAMGWGSPEPMEMPEGDRVLVGLTVELPSTMPTAEALMQNVTLASLGSRRAGDSTMMKLLTITPDTPDEQTEIASAVAGLALVFKGLAPAVTLEPSLHAFVSGLPAMATYPARQVLRSWRWQGASAAEVRRSGPVWIVVEKPRAAGGGIWLTILTDQFQRRS